LEKVVVFGADTYARMIHFYLSHDSKYQVVGFTVDEEYLNMETMYGLPIVPFEHVETAFPQNSHKMSVPLSFREMNRVRTEKYRQAKAKGYQLISYVSSKAATWPDLVIGENSLILESSIIAPFVQIGNNVIIAGSVVGHNSIVKDHCFLAAHAVLLSRVTVESYCFLGGNSTIRDGIRIARECLIGAGVTINHDTKEREVYTHQPPVLSPKPSNELSNLFTWPLR
jgi:sugar O-acyltransferase (sialic acid O-acetyltransferase NeuD family)